jgi:hypothetical protein
MVCCGLAFAIGLGVDHARASRNAHGVCQHGLIDVVARVHTNSAHELNEFAFLSEVMAARFVKSLADQVQGHIPNFRVFQLRES